MGKVIQSKRLNWNYAELNFWLVTVLVGQLDPGMKNTVVQEVVLCKIYVVCLAQKTLVISYQQPPFGCLLSSWSLKQGMVLLGLCCHRAARFLLTLSPQVSVLSAGLGFCRAGKWQLLFKAAGYGCLCDGLEGSWEHCALRTLPFFLVSLWLPLGWITFFQFV